MAIRPIITDQHNKILRVKAKRIGRIDDFVRRLIDDMVETMRAAPGVGLAAPQVGVPLRVIVVDAETYEVRADGMLLVCEPANVLSIAQGYLLV